MEKRGVSKSISDYEQDCHTDNTLLSIVLTIMIIVGIIILSSEGFVHPLLVLFSHSQSEYFFIINY